MQLHEWLDQQPGRTTWLAEKVGVSKGAVSQWRESGVPLHRIERVSELTGGMVTEAELLTTAMRLSSERKEKA